MANPIPSIRQLQSIFNKTSKNTPKRSPLPICAIANLPICAIAKKNISSISEKKDPKLPKKRVTKDPFAQLASMLQIMGETLPPHDLHHFVKTLEEYYIQQVKKLSLPDEKKELFITRIHTHFQTLSQNLPPITTPAIPLPEKPSISKSVLSTPLRIIGATSSAFPYLMRSFSHLQSSFQSRATIICYQLRDYPNHPLVQFIHSLFSKKAIDAKMQPFLPNPNNSAWDALKEQAYTAFAKPFVGSSTIDSVLNHYNPENQTFINNILFIMNYTFKEAIDRMDSVLRNGQYGKDVWLTEAALNLKDAQIYALYAALTAVAVYAGVKITPFIYQSTKNVLHYSIVKPVTWAFQAVKRKDISKGTCPLGAP